MTKDVHVDSYTRKDGTHVDDYYRSRPGNGSSEEDSADMFEIGVKEDVRKMHPVDILTHVKRKVFSSTIDSCQKANDVIDSIYDYYTPYSTKDISNVERSLQEFRKMHEYQKDAIQEVIDTMPDMSKEENKRYYSSFLGLYNEHLNLVKEADYQMRKAEYYYEIKNYEGMIQALNQYRAVFNSKMGKMKNLTNPARYIGQKNPSLQGYTISAGMNISAPFGKYHTNELWKLARNGVNNTAYIKRNGLILNSIKEAPLILQRDVKNKVKDQLHVEDSKGIYLRPDSSLAKKIVKDDGTYKYLNRNIEEIKKLLKPGEMWEPKSESYRHFTDLHLALGHFDIVDLHLDEDKNLCGYIIDTYDFNEDDPIFAVEWAYNVQEHGLLTNYFVIIEVSIPYKKWKRYAK